MPAWLTTRHTDRHTSTHTHRLTLQALDQLIWESQSAELKTLQDYRSEKSELCRDWPVHQERGQRKRRQSRCFVQRKRVGSSKQSGAHRVHQRETNDASRRRTGGLDQKHYCNSYQRKECLSITSNVTSRHRGPKQTLWPGLQSAVTTMHVLSTHPAPMLCQSYFSSASVVSHAFSPHVCAMHVFGIRASSSSPSRLPLCQITSLLRPPLLS